MLWCTGDVFSNCEGDLCVEGCKVGDAVWGGEGDGEVLGEEFWGVGEEVCGGGEVAGGEGVGGQGEEIGDGVLGGDGVDVAVAVAVAVAVVVGEGERGGCGHGIANAYAYAVDDDGEVYRDSIEEAHYVRFV